MFRIHVIRTLRSWNRAPDHHLVCHSHSGAMHPNVVLGEFIYRPVIFASPDHDDTRVVGMNGLPQIRFEREQRDGKCVSARLQFAAMANFKRRLGAAREKFLQAFLRGVLFGRVGKHHKAGFVVFTLPRMKKMISGSESADVIGIINSRNNRSASG
jgi:hypothetical protein